MTSLSASYTSELSLNGLWETGIDRDYSTRVSVPGLAGDPAQVTPGTVWYRRTVVLPEGEWTRATLTLYGARFCPRVYVNGDLVSSSEGGMTWTHHRFAHPAVQPGETVTLEIALADLDATDPGDASRIPAADRWRSNISSSLWDAVTLRCHGDNCLTRVIPSYDLASDTLTVHWETTGDDDNYIATVEILASDGSILAANSTSDNAGQTKIPLHGACELWSPETPHLYRLRVTLMAGARVLDMDEFSWAPRDFCIDGKKFRLNGLPVTFRAGSFVWHRFVRDREGRDIAWDTAWFEENIVRRLKAHGANGLRFHLGMPPEALLDLCDKYGLLVQAEWSFFHGMPGAKVSLLRQWRNWFDLIMRHPSIVIIHPWNETEGEELDTAFAALTEIVSDYPPLVIAHRDTLHIHKYWWGLFENIGLYYDSAEQFPQPIVVDEFGGNYLDGEGKLGGYPSLKESFLRFLGRGHTPELRLQLQTESNTQIAEYWRRLGAAGFSPFCMAGSWEDGNHHFLGPLCEGRPKPVWDGLTAAYSPVSCSLEVWDRNFIPGQAVTLPLYLFNETAVPRHMTVEVRLVASDGTVQTTHTVHQTIDASTTEHLTVDVTMPAVEGDWRLEAEVLDRPQGVLHPIISQWHVRTIVPTVPKVLCGATVAVPEEETELRALLAAHGLTMCALGDPAASVAIISRKTWELLQTDRILLGLLEATVMGGCGLVMLDIGPRELGQGYLEGGDLGPLQAVMTIANPGTVTVDLLGGMMLEFTETPEPESCVHPSEADNSLWAGLDQQATWLWNGLRGGLMVPARDMTPLGMNAEAFLTLWGNRGADVTSITGTEDYMAYELCGFYAFSLGESDQVQHDLRARVRFLYDDAPALQNSLDPNAPIRSYRLSTLYRQCGNARVESLTALANCGKSLARTPVVAVTFGRNCGTLILSQLITAGRLASGFGTDGLYGLRYDPAAEQVVLNMLARALK